MNDYWNDPPEDPLVCSQCGSYIAPGDENAGGDDGVHYFCSRACANAWTAQAEADREFGNLFRETGCVALHPVTLNNVPESYVARDADGREGFGKTPFDALRALKQKKEEAKYAS